MVPRPLRGGALLGGAHRPGGHRGCHRVVPRSGSGTGQRPRCLQLRAARTRRSDHAGADGRDGALHRGPARVLAARGRRVRGCRGRARCGPGLLPGDRLRRRRGVRAGRGSPRRLGRPARGTHHGGPAARGRRCGDPGARDRARLARHGRGDRPRRRAARARRRTGLAGHAPLSRSSRSRAPHRAPRWRTRRPRRGQGRR